MDNKNDGFKRLIEELASERPAEAFLYTGQTEDCLSFPRFFELILRPSTAAAAEREHLGGCAFCQKQMARSRKEAWHPNLGTDAEEIRVHVEEHGCESGSCRAVHEVRLILSRVDPILAELKRYISDWEGATFGFAHASALSGSPVGFSGSEKPNVMDTTALDPESGDLARAVHVSRFPAEPLEASCNGIDVMMWKEGDSLRVRVHTLKDNAGLSVRVRVMCPNGEILSRDIALKEVAGSGHGIADLDKKYSELTGGGQWILWPPELSARG